MIVDKRIVKVFGEPLGANGRRWEVMGGTGRQWEALGGNGRLWEALGRCWEILGAAEDI